MSIVLVLLEFDSLNKQKVVHVLWFYLLVSDSIFFCLDRLC